MWMLIGFALMGWYLASLQRQIDAIGQHVETLHSDVRDEIYERYGESFNGKK